MKFRFVSAQKERFPLSWMCRRLGVSRSGYYAWAQRGFGARRESDEQLGTEIEALHQKSRGTYGSPRIHQAIRRRRPVGRRRVIRLMQQRGLRGRQRRRFKRTTDSNHDNPVAPNLVSQQFNASEPNRLWTTDLTYIRTWEGWLYLAIVLDVFSRRVVGYAIDDHMRTELPLAALDMAIQDRRPKPGLIHHSDRGSQYTSGIYQGRLGEIGANASMSRRGNCYDNSVTESFFSTLKHELIYRASWPTKRCAVTAIEEFIETFYNTERMHSSIAYESPVEYELTHAMGVIAS